MHRFITYLTIVAFIFSFSTSLALAQTTPSGSSESEQPITNPTTTRQQIVEPLNEPSLFLRTEDESVVNLNDPDVEIIIKNTDGAVDIIVIETTPTPSPQGETVPPSQNTNPSLPSPTTEPARTIVVTPTTPPPVYPTSGSIIIYPTAGKVPVEVTVTPNPRPTEKVIYPSSSVSDPSFKTPTPFQIEPVEPEQDTVSTIEKSVDSFIDFVTGKKNTDSSSEMSEETKQLFISEQLSDQPQEVQDLFIQAGNFLTFNLFPSDTSPAGFNQLGAQRISDSSHELIDDYLKGYNLGITADDMGNIIIERQGVSVKVSVPVILDPQNRSFSVRTENGTIPVTYYPDTVKETLELSRVIDADVDMSLGFRGNGLVYVVKGCEEEFFFAFFPVCPSKEVVVSAHDLSVHEVRQSMISKGIDLLSI